MDAATAVERLAAAAGNAGLVPSPWSDQARTDGQGESPCQCADSELCWATAT